MLRVDLQRSEQTGGDRAPARERGTGAQQSGREMKQTGRHAKRIADPLRQFRDRHALLVGDGQGLARQCRHRQSCGDRTDGVVDIEQAATIADAGKRQPPPRGNRFHQIQKIALDPCAIGKRQAQHHAFERASSAGLPQNTLGFGFALRVGVAGRGGIAGAKRSSFAR